MLTWNVYVGDFNSRVIERHNVFDHWKFREDCIENRKKNGKNREAFVERLKRDLMYYYWSKCEWEVIVSHWPSGKNFRDEKIDVYDQVRLNWDHFADYVWNHKEDL